MDGMLAVVLLLPAVAAAAVLALRRPRVLLAAVVAVVLATALLDVTLAGAVLRNGEVLTIAGGWLRLDPLAAFHVAVLAIVFGLSSLYAWVYFGVELARGDFHTRQARQFAGLWLAALAAMQLTLCADNLGLMWVGMESTTLVTAFLVCLHVTKSSLEAMWKYVLVCSIGVGLAFMGTLLFAAAALRHGGGSEVLLWTHLTAIAGTLDPTIAKVAFLFILVGYGTKAGLAPMHSWLPDAHSQAPTPVSVIFSGFMLNTAFYCILRYLPIAEAATGGEGWAMGLLRGFGLASILVAAVFVLFQRDLKRFLAYSTVEHLGIIALGFGLGGLGTIAALYHTLNHSLAKTVAFFAAGRLGQAYGSHDLTDLAGCTRPAPLWGGTALLSILALIGLAPFAVFMSKLQIASAAVASGAGVALVVFLAGVAVVFIAALGHAVHLAWGEPRDPAMPRQRTGGLERLLAAAPLAAVLILGLWQPAPLRRAFELTADVLRLPPVPAVIVQKTGEVRP
jgi:hydrogenase-4 component F